MSLDDVHGEVSKKTEEFLITAIEQIEGRVPTNDELQRYGDCGFHLDGRHEWKWRGITILIVEPPNEDHPTEYRFITTT